MSSWETRCEELKKDLSDTRFDLLKAQTRSDRFEMQLSNALQELERCPDTYVQPSGQSQPETEAGKGGGVGEKGSASSIEDTEHLQSEATEQQALAESRLSEIGELSNSLQECRKELEVLKVEKKSVSVEDVRESSVFKSLQLQYSVMCQENQQLRTCVEELKKLVNSARSHHFVQLEEIRYYPRPQAIRLLEAMMEEPGEAQGRGNHVCVPGEGDTLSYHSSSVLSAGRRN